MKIKIAMVLLFGLMGCQQVNHLTGTYTTPTSNSHPAEMQQVALACCHTYDAQGHAVYPDFLPAAQVQKCELAYTACVANKCMQNGVSVLPMDVDCGKFNNKVGDEYYAGKEF